MGTDELHPEVHEQQLGRDPRYDLSPEEARLLCGEFLAGTENKPDAQFGCYVIGGTDDFSNLGRFVESTVFLEAFGNTPELMAEEYGPYEESSEFFVVVDHDSEMPIGVLRTIRNSEAGLKSLKDLEQTPLALDPDAVCEEFGIDPDKCIDVGTLAILPEFRARVGNILPSLLLYRTLYVRCLSNPDYDHVVTIIDQAAEKNLHKLSFPFKPIDERYFSYLDSPQSRALYGINKEFYPSVSRRQAELEEQAGEEQASAKHWYAMMLDGLANGTHLDEMLAFARPAESKH